MRVRRRDTAGEALRRRASRRPSRQRQQVYDGRRRREQVHVSVSLSLTPTLTDILYYTQVRESAPRRRSFARDAVDDHDDDDHDEEYASEVSHRERVKRTLLLYIVVVL